MVQEVDSDQLKASWEAASLILALLNKDPTLRLGALKGGAKDIREHLFFRYLKCFSWSTLTESRDVDWESVLKAEKMGPLSHTLVGRNASFQRF